jgi:hypothetical protein
MRKEKIGLAIDKHVQWYFLNAKQYVAIGKIVAHCNTCRPVFIIRKTAGGRGLHHNFHVRMLY